MRARSEDSTAPSDYSSATLEKATRELSRLRLTWFILGAAQLCVGLVALPFLTSSELMSLYGYTEVLPIILSIIGILVGMGIASILISFCLQKAKNHVWKIAVTVSLFYIALGTAAIFAIMQKWFFPILHLSSPRTLGMLVYIAIGVVLLLLLTRKHVRKHFKVHYASKNKAVISACIFVIIVTVTTFAIFYSYGYSRGIFAMETSDHMNTRNFESPLYILEGMNEWSTGKDMLTPREESSAAVIENRIYAVGGFHANGVSTNKVEVYDTKTNTWSAVKDLPLALDHPGVASYEGKLYVVGGMSRDVNGFGTLFIFDPVTNEWTRGADMPTPRGALTVQFVNGILYAVGGWNGEPLRVNEAYDPVTNTWATKSPMPTARDHLGSGTVNGKLYAIGGRYESWWRNFSVNEEYDPEKDKWSTKAPMPSPRGGLAVVSLSESIYVFGGENPLRALHYNEQYVPSLDKWLIRENMPTARHAMASAVVDGKIYLIGGSNNPGLSVVANNEIFSPVDWRTMRENARP
jgi:N-acetylneuraminic acid mutarotase